jgi:hypothetical protein
MHSLSSPFLPALLLGAAVASFGLCGTPALAADAHVHGQARLTVVLEDARLTLVLESPLSNLLGFEHMPRSAKDKAAVARMARLLNRPGELFVPTPAAGCKAGAVKLESPVLEAMPKAAKHGHDHGHEHADLDGEFAFTCARPALLRGLEVKLFVAFPGLKRLDVEVATGKGQTAAKLDGGRRRIDW